MIQILFYGFEPGGGDEGDGDGGKAFNLDYDALALLDALDGAFSSFEVAIGDADTFAGLGKEVCVFEVLHSLVLLGCHLDEVFHLTVWHGQDMVACTVGEAVHHVVHGGEFAPGHLQLGELLL